MEQDKLFSQHGVFAKIALRLQGVKGGKAKQKEVLREELERVNQTLPSSFQLPLDPQTEVGKLRVEECKVMDSAKKPLWLVFDNAEAGGKKVLAMFKAGDDLRQDCVTLQILDIMDDMWRNEGLNLHIEPYKCQATWHDGGMLQIVQNSETTASIHKRYGGNLGAYKNSTFADWIKDNNKENYDEVWCGVVYGSCTISMRSNIIHTFILNEYIPQSINYI
jgi:phosphatidylinositol-4,5-bisphosphate 3-kinase